MDIKTEESYTYATSVLNNGTSQKAKIDEAELLEKYLDRLSQYLTSPQLEILREALSRFIESSKLSMLSFLENAFDWDTRENCER